MELVKTSARNIIKTKVVNIACTRPTAIGVIDIHLVIDNIHLVSRITNQSRIHLGIKEGDHVYAMFKATSPQVIRELNVLMRITQYNGIPIYNLEPIPKIFSYK